MEKIDLENTFKDKKEQEIKSEELINQQNEDTISLKQKVEAILFLSGDEVLLNEMARSLNFKESDLEKELDKIKDEKSMDNNDIYEIVKINSNLIESSPKYRLVVKKDISDSVISFFDNTKEPKITPKAMEVLSIIAYNQNITRAHIESIRGVASDSLVSRLMDLGLIKEGTQHDTLGRPMGYVTTDKFLMVFGLESLEDLPTMDKVDISKESEKFI